MIKPSDFSPAEAFEVSTSSDTLQLGVILPDASKRGAYRMIERLDRSIATTPLMEHAELEPAIVQQAESEIAAQSGPDNEQGPAMDIPEVSRRPGQNVFKPKVHQT